MMHALTWMPALCAAAFPLHPRATTPVLGLWVLLLLWVEFTNRRKHIAAPIPPRFWWAGLAYYVLIAIGLLWSDDLEAGLFALEVKLTLLLLPVMFYMTERHVRWNKKQVIDALCLGLLVSGSIGLIQAGWSFVVDGEVSGWSYAELAQPLHPTYSAWYWAFAWFAWLTIKRPAVPWLLGSLFAGLMIGLLASKAGWIAGGLVVAWNMASRHRRMATGFGVLGLLLGATLFGQGRVTEMVDVISQSDAKASNPSISEESDNIGGSTVGRLQAWEAASALLVRNPIGVGTGDVRSELVESYQVLGAHYAADHAMNAHNAYLEAGVAFGWLGLLLLLVWWGATSWMGWRARQELAMGFSVLACWFACTESVLELQSGVVWIAFGCWAWGVRVKGDGN